MPLAYDALGAPSSATRLFLKRISDGVPPFRRDHFFSISTLVLSVALARSTAHILTERTEAIVAGEDWSDPIPALLGLDSTDLEWQVGGALFAPDDS